MIGSVGMIVIVILMLVSVAAAARGFWRVREPAITLNEQIVSARTQALAWGVVVLTAMMPAVRCGSVRYGAMHSLALSLVLALEAGQCLATVFVRGYITDQIRTEWQARVWSTVVNSDVVS